MVEVVICAVLLLIGAFAAIMICLCADASTYIKSRGSTLVSRDSFTRAETQRLRESLKRNGLLKKNLLAYTGSSAEAAKTYSAHPNSERIREEEIPFHAITTRVSSTSTTPTVKDSSFCEVRSATSVGRSAFSGKHLSASALESLSNENSDSPNVSVAVSVHLSTNQQEMTSSSHPANSRTMNVYKYLHVNREERSEEHSDKICKVQSTSPPSSPFVSSSLSNVDQNQASILEHCRKKASKEEGSLEISASPRSPDNRSRVQKVQNNSKICTCNCAEKFNLGAKNYRLASLKSASNESIPNCEQLSDQLASTSDQLCHHNRSNLKASYKSLNGINVTPRSTPVLPSSLHGSGIRQRVSPYSASSTPSPTSLSSSSHSGSRNHRTILEDIKEDISCPEEEEHQVETKPSASAPKRSQVNSSEAETSATYLHANDVSVNPLAHKVAAKSKTKLSKGVDFKGKPKAGLQSAAFVS